MKNTAKTKTAAKKLWGLVAEGHEINGALELLTMHGHGAFVDFVRTEREALIVELAHMRADSADHATVVAWKVRVKALAKLLGQTNRYLESQMYTESAGLYARLRPAPEVY